MTCHSCLQEKQLIDTQFGLLYRECWNNECLEWDRIKKRPTKRKSIYTKKRKLRTVDPSQLRFDFGGEYESD